MNMKQLALAAGAALTAVAATASAQYYQRDDGYRYDSRRSVESECWNPRAGHFEQVRPGESQNDLDMSRCRAVGERNYDRSYDRNYDRNYDRSSERREWRESREECWNPRARHFEEVRRDERQDDLDFSRCRVVR